MRVPAGSSAAGQSRMISSYKRKRSACRRKAWRQRGELGRCHMSLRNLSCRDSSSRCCRFSKCGQHLRLFAQISLRCNLSADAVAHLHLYDMPSAPQPALTLVDNSLMPGGVPETQASRGLPLQPAGPLSLHSRPVLLDQGLPGPLRHCETIWCREAYQEREHLRGICRGLLVPFVC